jgi:hypothetical protein
MFDAIRLDGEPFEVLGDPACERAGRALAIGVVIAQHELTARLPGKQPVDNGGARIAHMEPSGGRGRETDGRHRRTIPVSKGN